MGRRSAPRTDYSQGWANFIHFFLAEIAAGGPRPHGQPTDVRCMGGGLVGNPDIAGDWEGRYLFDEANPAFPRDGVPFAMTLAAGWFGRIRGTVREDPSRGGMPEEGRIRGRIRGERIILAKRMPICYINGPRPLSTYILEEHGVDIGPSPPHPPILCEGRYDPWKDSASGHWCIGPHKIRIWAGGATIKIDIKRATGTWEMRRPAGFSHFRPA